MVIFVRLSHILTIVICRYAGEKLPIIENFMTKGSVANLGDTNWTQAGALYCNNNGFLATVCAPGGWDYPEPAWQYECGVADADPNTKSVAKTILGLFSVRYPLCHNTLFDFFFLSLYYCFISILRPSLAFSPTYTITL